MGTNYYLYGPECPHCLRSDPPLHIGKSSAGWFFSLRVSRRLDDGYPISLEEWRERWGAPGVFILDEYGGPVDAVAMERVITERPGPLRRHEVRPGYCGGRGPGTYDFMICVFS